MHVDIELMTWCSRNRKGHYGSQNELRALRIEPPGFTPVQLTRGTRKAQTTPFGNPVNKVVS